MYSFTYANPVSHAWPIFVDIVAIIFSFMFICFNFCIYMKKKYKEDKI